MPTYGSSGTNTRQDTINWNALLTATMFNYNKKLVDNVSKRNIIWKKLKEKGLYESATGGIAIQENLLYAVNSMHYYSGYDVLRREPIDGITTANYDWTECATPIMISDTEKFKNKGRAQKLKLLETKIQQAEIGIKEAWLGDFLQGKERTVSGGGIQTNPTDVINGATGLDPISKLIAYDPTASLSIGGLNQSTVTWWRNKFKNAGGSAVKPLVFLDLFNELYMSCSNNSLGAPDLILVDDVTYRLLEQAMRHDHREIKSYTEYPDFENFRFKNAMVVWDDRIPNVSGGNTDTSVASGKGSAFFINTDFMKIRYEENSDFTTTPFMRPVDQMADVAYIIWRGSVTMTNRRAHGVMGNIPRSLDLS